MRKLFTNKNKKGFAMAELLAVSIVLLFIFSILFSNYLPLVAEYETRLSYNDVTAQYAAHYIRKMYKEALDDTTAISGTGSTKGEQLKSTISTGISARGYFTVYSGNSDDQIFSQVSEQENCERIIKQYGIEEIIITNYKLKDDKDTTATTKYVKGNYKKDSGSLYNYIKYLPNYEKSIYTGNDLSTDSIQLYRIILKTKDYGYATTPILFDYKTPGSCFEGVNVGANKLKITKYFYNEDNGCGKVVTISNTSIETANGVVGRVTAIGDDVFRKMKGNDAYQITELNIFSDHVKTIGGHAFDGSLLEKLPDSDKLNNVTSIGEYAFANTKIDEVNLENFSKDSYIGDYAFADNKKLTTVKLPKSDKSDKSDIYSSNSTLTKGLFARSGTEASGIAVTIPAKMKNVGDEMFYLAKIKSITLEEGVETIGDKAFSQFNGSSLTNNKLDSDYTKITIPSSVINIGYGSYIAADGINKVNFQDCFRGLGITSLSFVSSSEELTIGVSAFRDNNISVLDIPSHVVSIQNYAFENNDISDLSFSADSKLKIIGAFAFATNYIKSLGLPNSINSIGNSAFQANRSLEFVELPENPNYTTISNGLFQGGNKFESIYIPRYVKTIGESAFNPGNYSSELKIVNFEEGSQLTTINGTAFANNDNLEEFTIPQNVSNIINRAFASCGALTKITNNSSQVIDKLYSKGCAIFFRDVNSDGSCSSSISDDRKNIVISYEKGYTVTITNNYVE